MRGKLDPLRGVGADDGLIPAHTGKTRAQPQHRDAIRAHPRSRGENPSTARRIVCHVGSSPLTRGKRRRLVGRAAPTRLIPAHAGKTAPRSPPRSIRRAHPHSRGENYSASARIATRLDSSPLTQGKRRIILPTDRPVRPIPAHAGKTQRRRE